MKIRKKLHVMILASIALISFLILVSSAVSAVSGQDNASDIQKNTVNQTEDSPEFESAPLNPEFVNYTHHKIYNQNESSEETNKTGFVPAPVDLSHLSNVSAPIVSAPDYYDLRTLNKVTSVKDQGNLGTCWAFATYAALESDLMPEENRDFSENNMRNLLSPTSPEGFDFPEGGNFFMSTAYLARWSGPVNETDDPYNESSAYSSTGLPVQKHAKDVFYIPAREGPLDNENIKSALQNYGAVYTSMYSDPDYYSTDGRYYYYNGLGSSNHAVAIVGWNDSFDKNKFPTVPPGNGAFIVKNSWGESWGEEGYFYVSYYDTIFGYSSNVVFTAENPNNYKSIYQYDPLGWTDSVGYSSPTCWCANIFTARSNDILKAVSFYTTDSNCNYEIYIYTDPELSPTNQTGLVLSQIGTMPYAGYHTIPLNYGVNLRAGQRFSVVLKLTTPEYGYPIAVEMPVTGSVSYSSKATANAGESFVSLDGITWEDITTYFPNTDACIKAFTEPTLLPVANFTSNISEGYAPLTVQFNDSSTNATSLNWDFENDGTVDSTEQKPVHTFESVGNYTVNLTVSNANGTASKSTTIKVLSASSIPVFPGYANPPIDLNHDDLYEDINGNGILDFDDVIAYYVNMDWIEQNAQVVLFDYNKNSIIDFDDVIKLYNML